MRSCWLWLLSVAMVSGCHRFASSNKPHAATPPKEAKPARTYEVTKSADEWRKILTPMQYYILRGKGTEPGFAGEYWNHHEDGTYACVGCGQELFSSKTKFDSPTGWPSFYEAIDKGRVELQDDDGSVEALCSRCGGHLGHVFDDGPKPTGKRYCINSACLEFKKATTQRAKKNG